MSGVPLVPPPFAQGYNANASRPSRFQYMSNSATVVDFFSGPQIRISSKEPTPKTPPTFPAGKVGASQILPFLFLGSLADAQNDDFLARNNITEIVNISTVEYSVPESIKRHAFAAADHAAFPINQIFPECFTIFDELRKRYVKHRAGAGQSTSSPFAAPAALVHCEKGISRSPSVVIAYLVKSNGWSVVEAYKFVQDRRPIIEPNAGFMEILRQFEQSAEIQSERHKLRMALLFPCKNVRKSATEEDVKRYFEATVGPVWGIMRKSSSVDPSDPTQTLWFVNFAMRELVQFAKELIKKTGPNPLAEDSRGLLLLALPKKRKPPPDVASQQEPGRDGVPTAPPDAQSEATPGVGEHVDDEVSAIDAVSEIYGETPPKLKR